MLSIALVSRLCDISRTPGIIAQSLGIIRNITCVTQNEVVNALHDCGETQLLGLLLCHVARASTHEAIAVEVSSRCLSTASHDSRFRVLSQALYCLNNIATSGEASQLAIASRTEILRYLIHHLVRSVEILTVIVGMPSSSCLYYRITRILELEPHRYGLYTISSIGEVLTLHHQLCRPHLDNVDLTRLSKNFEHWGWTGD